jgi:hypothetical protein
MQTLHAERATVQLVVALSIAIRGLVDDNDQPGLQSLHSSKPDASGRGIGQLGDSRCWATAMALPLMSCVYEAF